MFPVFVINLPSSEARRDKVSKRLSALGVPFELFEAVDGREKPHPLFDRYDSERCKRHRRKCMSGGELGCFASHFLLWQRCVELGQPVVVMEDDVYVTDAFVQNLSTADKLIADLGYLRLAGTSLHRRPYHVIGHANNLELVDHIRGPSGTLCYVISPRAAQALIDAASCWYLAVDDYMDSYWHHGIDCYSLMPYSVLVADNGSDIARLGKAKMSLWGKVKLEVIKRLERLHRGVYRLRTANAKRSLVESLRQRGLIQTNSHQSKQV